MTRNIAMTGACGIAVLMMSLLMCSCEKGYIVGSNEDDDENSDDNGSTANVSIITRMEDDNSACTRIDVGLFQDGTKVKAVNSTEDDDDFGNLSLALDDGTYDIVIIAHNGTGAATISSADEIKFSNNKVTDTYYFYGTITINGTANYNITLHRAVAMFRLIISDDTPDDVVQMKFYYTGGSSTFDATTGYGCVNSRQTEYRDVETSAYTGSSQYEIYTFPHNDDDVLKIVVTAQSDLEESLYEATFTDVLVNIGEVTQYTGNFFETSSSNNTTIAVSMYDEWVVNEYTY